MKLFNDQFTDHAELSVLADAAVVFECAGLVSYECDCCRFTCLELLGPRIEVIDDPIMEPFIVLHINRNSIAFLDLHFLHVEREVRH